MEIAQKQFYTILLAVVVGYYAVAGVGALVPSKQYPIRDFKSQDYWTSIYGNNNYNYLIGSGDFFPFFH